jgi:WS/DGAT/MGAT family acyltransferase
MEQLPGRDAIFLSMETDVAHAHIGALSILDPSASPDFSFEKVVRITEERIRLVPRFTMKLREVPFGLDKPYWVEDPDFDVRTHIHRIAVPAPGGIRELAALCGDLSAHQLDRRRPLWEMWFIEGLEGGRVAMLSKNHHCMIDGVSGAGLGEMMADLEPNPPPRSAGPPKPKKRAERQPSDFELLARGLWKTAGTPLRFARYATQAARRGVAMLPYLQEEGAGLGEAPRLPFNDMIGPRRAVAFSSVPLGEVKRLKKHFGVKVNDVILELCGSALRRYLKAQNELPRESLFVSVPISTRPDDDPELGNKVANMMVSWATDLEDPAERVRQIHKNTQKSKEMTEAMRAREIQAMGDTAPPAILNLAIRMLSSTLATLPTGINAIVSNVPGPPVPLYTAGARIETMYPISIIQPGMGLNFTVMSYIDRVDFGITVDPDLVPDPWYIAEGIPLAIEALSRAAEDESATPPPTRRRRAPRRDNGPAPHTAP